MAALGMIADDLTGACDAGVHFAEAGLNTVVLLEAEAADGDMTVLTTGSRADSSDTARAKVREACLWMERRGIRLAYKKIDSTLCGNVEAEIEAALDSTGRVCAWVCPAFPAMGRTVVNGWLHVGGERVARVPSGHRIRALDAANDEDLARIAAEAFAASPAPLLAGSAGLAAHVARRTGGRERPALPLACAGPIALCVGSANPTTAAQVERLRAERPGMQTIRMRWNYGDVAAIESTACGALIATGGDTARRVCQILKTGAIRLECEISSGIPVGRLVCGRGDGKLMATKAGGFGGPDALIRITEFLEACCQPSR